jgi:hypothetical protein
MAARHAQAAVPCQPADRPPNAAALDQRRSPPSAPHRLARQVVLPRCLLALVTSLLLAACGGGGGDGAGGGAPVTVGPTLNFSPLSNVTCADGLVVQLNASFPQPFGFQGASSCTILTISAGAAANQPVMQPSGPGRVTTATVRVGPVTGPMRFLRMRVSFQNGFGAFCCSVEQIGATFTPQPNADTTVTLNFAMGWTPLPPPTDTTTIAFNDRIALQVLAPNVPIPGIWRRNGGQEPFLDTELWQALPLPGQNQRGVGSYSGFMPAFNFQFVPG